MWSKHAVFAETEQNLSIRKRIAGVWYVRMFDLTPDIQLVCADSSVQPDSWQASTYANDFNKMVSEYQTTAIGPWFQEYVGEEVLMQKHRTSLSNLKLEERRCALPEADETPAQTQARMARGRDFQTAYNNQRQIQLAVINDQVAIANAALASSAAGPRTKEGRRLRRR